MKVKIKSWNALATWVWNIENESQCAICQSDFESPCPRCKVPGDECPPSKMINKKILLQDFEFISLFFYLFSKKKIL